MAGFMKDIEGGFVDNTADRAVDDFIPDKNGEFGRVAETGVNQFVNNEINSRMAPGAFDGNSDQNAGGNYDNYNNQGQQQQQQWGGGDDLPNPEHHRHHHRKEDD